MPCGGAGDASALKSVYTNSRISHEGTSFIYTYKNRARKKRERLSRIGEKLERFQP